MKERFVEMINFLKYEKIISSQLELAEKTGYNVSVISQMANGKKPLTLSFIDNINKLITNDKMKVNYNYLLTGNGDLHTFEEDKSVELSEPKQEEEYYTYLLPVSAEGGSLSGFADSVALRDCERIISPISGADFAISVHGDSMAPEYPNGSKVIIKRVNERAFIEWGKAYVLDTCNGVVIKKLMPSSKGEEYVSCVSVNPDYPPFDVCLEDVYRVYRVMLCMSVK